MTRSIEAMVDEQARRWQLVAGASGTRTRTGRW